MKLNFQFAFKSTTLLISNLPEAIFHLQKKDLFLKTEPYNYLLGLKV